jgi:Flp pilus assembly protein TadG
MPHAQLRRKRRRGEALVEFTMIGIPLLFLWVSTVEMSRGMWQYHTLQYATKIANAYAAIHGATCSSNGNSCTVNVSDIVTQFQNNAIGIPMSSVKLVLVSKTSTNSVTCTQVSTCSSNGAWSTQWPPTANGDNAVGNSVEIKTYYTFNTALAMFWPGSGSPWSFGSAAGPGKFVFPGYSYELIQF